MELNDPAWVVAGAVLCHFLVRLARGAAFGFWGNDQWYWLLVSKEAGQQRRLFPRNRHFVLEGASLHYPPVFPLLMGVVPHSWWLRLHPFLGPALESLQAGILTWIGLGLGWTIPQAIVAAATLALVPVAHEAAGQLSPKPLGGLLSVSFVWVVIHEGSLGPWSFWLAAGILAITLLTHKMSVQWMLVVLLVWVIRGRMNGWVALGTVGVGIGMALAISGGYYAKVLRGHLVILRFWARNRTLHGAHQFHRSPLYGGSPTVKDSGTYPVGILALPRMVGRLVLSHPIAWCVLAWSFLHGWGIGGDIGWWCLSACVMAAATLLVPQLRFLGPGHLYTYFAGFPAAWLAANGWGSDPGAWIGFPLVWLACMVVSIASVARLIRLDRSREPLISDLKEACRLLRNRPRAVTLCFPTNLWNPLAYFSDDRVVAGGHGQDFDELEKIYPVLQIRVEDIVRDYNVSRLLIQRSYVDIQAVWPPEDHGFRKVWESPRFSVYEAERSA